VQGGKLRALAQTGKSRVTALPDIPTLMDAGFPDFEAYAWWGVFTAAPTPAPIVERFRAALVDALNEPTIKKQISENLQITMLLGGPEEKRTFLAQQMKLWGPVVREHGIKGE
jgi:tripartite-type tricarboxylate transporter receptor subunit TctC